MVRRGERSEGGEASLRREAADRMILARQMYLSATHGTADHAGYDPVLWRPYHVVENRIWTQAVENVFTAAFASKTTPGSESPGPSPLSNLEQDDLPAMLIAASHFYPDLTKLYDPSSSLAKPFMERSRVFRERDYEIVEACINAAVVKESPEDIIAAKSLDDGASGDGQSRDYRVHKKVFVDALWGSNQSLPQTMYLMALLGVERLIEQNGIHTGSGAVPRTLAEVTDPSTEYNSDILRDHIVNQNTNFFRANSSYIPQLDTSNGVLPHFLDNQTQFIAAVLPKIKQRHISIADFLQETRTFSLHGRPDNSGDGWVASLS